MSELDKNFYYIIANSRFSYLSKSWVHLVKTDKLKGNSYKLLKKMIKELNLKAFELQLLKYFKMYDIPYPNKKQYDSKVRQYIFRERNKEAHKKQINFYVDANLYNSIVSLKNELGFSYSELMDYFIKKEKGG